MGDKDDALKQEKDRMAAEGGDQCLAAPQLEPVCAGCGARKADWPAPQGIKAGGTVYCSPACAEKFFTVARGKVSKAR